jgi:hypothetical protein
VPELGGVPIVAGVELEDARVELMPERRHPRDLVGCHGHDHVFSLEESLARLHHEAAPVSGQPVYPDAGSDRKLEPRCVGLEVVAHLVLGRERVTRPREGHSREGVVAGRREEPKRVPPLSPRVADPLVRLEDHEREAPLGEVVSDREASLATADDNGLDTLWFT